MDFLIIYVADNCKTCSRVITAAKSAVYNYPNLTLKIKNIKDVKRRITIVPAVYLNNSLFCYGEFDKAKLIEHILEETKQETI